MKIKLPLMLAGVALFFAWLRAAEASSCTAGRIHFINNGGCDPRNGGAGGVPKAKCPDCPGMPQWWVPEPYVNLEMSDTPLSYTLSSGQAMAFTWYYDQHYELPKPDEVPNFYRSASSYTRHDAGITYSALARTCGLTNAAWSGNWMKDIVFWDSQWEDAAAGYNAHYPIPPFYDGYEALVFCPEGNIQYFYSTNNNAQASLQNLESQVKLQPLSALGYPTVNTAAADTNGIYWGGSQTNGFQMIYPDGSKEIFGLCYYPEGLLDNYAAHFAYTGAHAFLTQRIDPQGRVTQLGYQTLTNYNGFWFGYGLRYVVDPDGRTNTFNYATNPASFYLYTTPNPWELQGGTDPYGRKVQVGYDFVCGILTSLTDAAGLTSSFKYQTPAFTNHYYYWSNGVVMPTNVIGLASTSAGWITNLTTPYGTTRFSYFEVPDASLPDAFQKRAIYVSEPTGAQQLYYYLHNGSGLMAATGTAPTVPGQTDFNDGNAGANHPTLDYRNTIYWGRRQCAALASSVLSLLSSNLGQALTNLTASVFKKGRTRNWLWQPDGVSLSDALASEQAPSPDAAGAVAGLRTWYNYAGKSSPETLGSLPQVICIARLLADGASQYTTYNYYSQLSVYGGGPASDHESSYSKPDGSVGVLTNWFRYAYGSIDLISVSNSIGQHVNLGYNNHQIVAVTNALNQVTTLSWNPNLTGIQWPGGQSVSLGYINTGYWDTNGNFVPDPNNGFLQTVSWSPSSRSFTINSNYAGLRASVTDDRGLTVASTWDGLNRLTGTSFPDNTTISNIYNRLDLVADKDRLNNWTSYSFDGLQHLTTVTNANNAVTTYSWCGCGSLTTILDALTNLTTLNYDNQGNLTNVLYPDYSSVTYQFDLAGRMTNAFDGAGRAVRLGYNNQGLVTNVAGANGTWRSATYDAVNRPIRVTDANGVTMTNTFDALGELLTRTRSGGALAATESFGSNAAGLIAYTNADQQVTRYALDGAGRVLAVTNANLEITQFTWDSLDNLLSLVDGLNHTRTWQYNEYGWLTNKVDALNRPAFRYAYNANGWVTNRWTPETGNTGYTFDNVGNLKFITYPQQTINYAYDALNRLTNMVDAVGTHAFRWTAAGQLQSESDTWTTVSYSYVQGLRTLLTLSQPGTNWTQSYGYGSGWRMHGIASPAGTFGYSYNFQPASSLVTGISLPNGAKIANSYDSLARLQETDLNNYWGHTLDGYTYGLDPLGLKTNLTRDFGLTRSSVKVGYDNIQQLIAWNASETNGTPRLNEQFGWAYDAANNLLSRTNKLLVQTFTVDAADELINVSRTGTFTLSGATPAPANSVIVNGNPAQTYGDFAFASTNLSLVNGTNTFTIVATNLYGVRTTNIQTVVWPASVPMNYDNNGNLTNDGLRSLAYDTENQLTNVMVAGQWKSEFAYDGLNRRRITRDYRWDAGTSGWVKTNEVRLIDDGYQIIQERDTNNNVLVTYTRGFDMSGSLAGTGGIGGLLARTDANGSTFYHADGSGNITALMDGGENIVARYQYGAFGKLTGMCGVMAPVNVMRFSSKPYLLLSDEYDFGSRRYRTDPPGWTTADPHQEAGGNNLRQFARNNPLRFIDPDGKAPQVIGASYDFNTGSGSAVYQDQQFGQGYGIADRPSDPFGALDRAWNYGFDQITPP